MRPQVDYRQARADAVAQQSQTRTWSGVVIDSMAVNGTCKVRMSGGATQVCTLPPNTTVDYGQVVLVCRYPGTTRPVIMSAGNNGLDNASQIVSAQVTASLTVHELSGALHTGVLADAQVPVTIPRLAAANVWTASQSFTLGASIGVAGTPADLVIYATHLTVPWKLHSYSVVFNGTRDDILSIGFNNWNHDDATRAGQVLQLENDYNDGAQHSSEYIFAWVSPDQSISRRPYQINVTYTGAVSHIVGGYVSWYTGDGVTPLFYVDDTNRYFGVNTGSSIVGEAGESWLKQKTGGGSLVTLMNLDVNGRVIVAPAGGATLIAGSVGVGFTGATPANVLLVQGTATPSISYSSVLFNNTVNPTGNTDVFGLENSLTVTTPVSVATSLIQGFRVDIPSITLGGGSTLAFASSMYIAGAPTVGTNKYALYVDGGSPTMSYFAGDVTVAGKYQPGGTATFAHRIANDADGMGIVGASTLNGTLRILRTGGYNVLEFTGSNLGVYQFGLYVGVGTPNYLYLYADGVFPMAWDSTGNVSIGKHYGLATLHVYAKTTTVNAPKSALRLEAQVSTASTGGAAGFGPAIELYAETATDETYQPQARIRSIWVDPANATRTANLILSAYDTTEREGLRITATGSGVTVSVPNLDVYYSVGSVYARMTTDSAGNLTIDPTGGLIKPGTGDALQSQTYTSDLQGWKINASGDAEFNNITARGALRVAVLQYGYILATGGSVWITRAAGRLLNDCTTDGTFTIDIEDPDGMTHAAAGALWAVSDIVRLKEPLTGDVWAAIDGVTDMTTFWRLTLLTSDTGTIFRAGLAVLNYGPPGSGLIQLSADAAHAPYMQMATISAADTFTLLTRIGNLNGCFDYSTDVYGFVAGNYAASNSSIAVDATNGIRIFNGTTVVGQWDVSGNISVGNAGSEHVYITSTSVQIKDNTSIYTDLTAGALTLGLVSGGEYVSIDGTNGLRLYGNAVLLGQWTAAGGIVIGEVANSKSRIEIASGAISLISRSAGGADTTKISLAADGSAAFTGSITAASGTIGGWTIGATALTASLVEGIMVGLDSGGTNPAFYAGSTIPGSAPFRVTMAGALTATDATITGTIDANAGHIGALDVDGILTIAAAGEIRQGTGTLGSNFTGLRVWNDTSVGRIGGYAADVLQWYAGTDGKLYAGGGNVYLDATGLNLVSGASSYNHITWYGGGHITAYISADPNDGTPLVEFGVGVSATGDGKLTLRNYQSTTSFGVCLDATVTTPAIEIFGGASVFLGDTANTGMTLGLTINQDTNDDEILAFKSSDVAHGITDYAETDTFTAYSKYSATAGGLRLRCFSEDIVGMQVSGMVTNGDTTRSTAAVGAIVLNAAKKTGTAVTVMGANENLLVVSNANSARMIVDAEGDLHLDATSNINVWDAYDDVALLTAYRSISAQKVFGDWVEEHALLLEETGIITRNPDGHHFVSVKGLTALIIDAIRQLSLKVEQHENQLTERGQGSNLDKQIPFRR